MHEVTAKKFETPTGSRTFKLLFMIPLEQLTSLQEQEEMCVDISGCAWGPFLTTTIRVT